MLAGGVCWGDRAQICCPDSHCLHHLAYFGSPSVVVGLYYGLQTVVFEVGLAFVVARYAVSRGKLGKNDAEAFGLGFGFWENAILLGAFSLVNLLAYYFILSSNMSVNLFHSPPCHVELPLRHRRLFSSETVFSPRATHRVRGLSRAVRAEFGAGHI